MLDPHDQIDHWFTFHPPTSPERRDAHVAVRDRCRQLAHALVDTVPPSNELDGALWYLRHVAMWANAGLALSPDPDDSRPPSTYEGSASMMTDRSGSTNGPGLAPPPGVNLLTEGCPGGGGLCPGATP
ncbi:hypothetical protein AB0F88_17305 [Streptosporangium sp. NPDC023963]|uniref:Acb2/Tad1 domain-containing protein n=1 Tax=Streptosporangium sp. NPDC023963 TaxID=3155608 RepID=UPI00343AB172